MKILSSGGFATISSHSPGVPAYSLLPTILLFSLLLLPCSQCKTYHPYPAIQILICSRHGIKLSQILLGNISYEYILLFFTIIIIGCYYGNSGNVMAFGKFFITSLIGLIRLQDLLLNRLHVRNWFEEL